MAAYALINLIFITAVLGVLWRLRVLRWDRAVWLTLTVLVVATAVFDSLIIQAGIVAYDDSLRSGIDIWQAPIEDFAYALLAAVMVPALWRYSKSVRCGIDTLRVLVMTSRPISWINTAYPFALGYLLLGGSVDTHWLIGTLFFLVPYNLLMYGINDVFDYESDIRNPRKGGVEGAVTPKAYHGIIIGASIGLSLPFVVAMTMLGTGASSAVLAILLFFVVAYSLKGLRFKEVPLLDSLTSSIHFVGPLVYAYVLMGAPPAAWWAALAFLSWGMASHALGAIQDIIPDRKAGISSIATVLGARTTARLVLALYVLAVGSTASLGGWAWLVAAAAVLYVVNVAPFVNIVDARSGEARAAWKRFLWLNMIAGAAVTIASIMQFV
ncbi:prenyltransferase [Candidatus Saccharibacteria bacterium]|nr:MAG: prenyltransferase [Candidatus Saccharibacteria bacterium]